METMQTVIGESHALNTALDHISNLAELIDLSWSQESVVPVKKSRQSAHFYLPGGRALHQIELRVATGKPAR